MLTLNFEIDIIAAISQYLRLYTLWRIVIIIIITIFNCAILQYTESCENQAYSRKFLVMSSTNDGVAKMEGFCARNTVRYGALRRLKNEIRAAYYLTC